MKFKLFATVLTFVSLSVVACSNDDDGMCGEAILGETCQTSAATCTPLVCSGGSYVCPAGTKEVPVTPSSCEGGDSGVSAACVGDPPVDSTCQASSGLCSELLCIEGSYACPTGTTEVAASSATCGLSVDSGTVDDSGIDAGAGR